MYEDELTGYEQHLAYESGSFGDARRCPRHPHVKTSSDDGMFDGVCGECEADMNDAADEEEWKKEHDPSNPFRRFCGEDNRVRIPMFRFYHMCTPPLF